MKTTATKQQQTETVQPKANKQAGMHQILQRYKQQTAQLQAAEEEELLQGKFETAQRMELDEEEPLQGKFETTQLAAEAQAVPVKPNNTGLPDQLKSGIENMSGYSMDDVKVHYNSDKPAQLQAHAYAQGTDIHIAPGQEKHLPHEAWHVVQQKQGRVKPTMQMKGSVPVNDDAGLEKEADVMGAKAFKFVENKSNNVIEIKKTANNNLQLKSKENNIDHLKIVQHNIIQMMGESLEEEVMTFEYSDHIAQRIVDQTVPINSRIVLDLDSMPGYLNTGVIIRPSRVKKDCMVVEFDIKPGEYYRVHFNQMSVIDPVASSALIDPVASAALDTDVDAVKTDVNSAMKKLKDMITNNEDKLNKLKAYGRDHLVYAPILLLWTKMDGLLNSWDENWSIEDTCGLMLDIGLHLKEEVKEKHSHKFNMTEGMVTSRRREGVKGSNWERGLPIGTKTQNGVSATTIWLLKTLSKDVGITALEIEAVMNGVCMYWNNSSIKQITKQYHTTAEVWSVYHNFLYPTEKK